MNTNPHDRNRPTRPTARGQHFHTFVRLAMVLALAGMAVPVYGQEKKPQGGRVGYGDFVRQAEVSGQAPAEPAAAGRGNATTPRVITPAQASGGLDDVALLTGRPAYQPSAGAQPSEPAVFVDSLVGQINGRPVFAQEFLRPLDARLRAEAARSASRQAWIRTAGPIIRNALLEQIREELLLAEARAALTPEERQGLIRFFTDLRKNLASSYFGSEQFADQRLFEQEGLTLEEKARDERDRALLRTLVQRYISPRVNVSWRDVKKDYERRIRDFVPAPSAVVRVVWVPAGDAAARAKISEQIAGGVAFKTIAESELNQFLRSEGGLVRQSFDGPLSEATIVGVPELNKAIQGLSVGQVAGPIETQGRAAWVMLEAIEQKPGRSLADAQIDVFARLRDRRFAEETNRFFERIRERGTKTDESKMLEQLIVIATERYWVPAQRGGGTPAPAVPGPSGGAPRP